MYLKTSTQYRYGCAWARTGTDLVVTFNDHGHAVGDMAIVRNTNVAFQTALITAVTANTYTVTTTNTGGTSGTDGAYGMGFTYAHTGAVGSITGGVLSAPASAGADVQILSMRFHMAPSTRTGTTYTITLPIGNLNGTGLDTSIDDVFLPNLQVRQENINLTGVGAGWNQLCLHFAQRTVRLGERVGEAR